MEREAFTTRPAGPAEVGVRCPICQTAVAGGEAVGACPGCRITFHAECWGENGGCGTYGCELAPAPGSAEGPPAAEPSTFWGQEEKVCPRCQGRIRVAALRCRHCGEVFAGRAPDAMRRPAAGSGGGAAWLVFVTGVLPFTAPLALLLGGGWLLRRRRELPRWPTTRRVAAIVGVAAAGIITVVLAAAVIAAATGRATP